jgi:hypothetical protein
MMCAAAAAAASGGLEGILFMTHTTLMWLRELGLHNFCLEIEL